MAPPDLDYQRRHGEHDEQHQEQDTLSPARPVLVPFRLLEDHSGLGNADGGLLDVVLDRIEKGALVDNERGEVFEELSEVGDGVCEFGEGVRACSELGVGGVIGEELGLRLGERLKASVCLAWGGSDALCKMGKRGRGVRTAAARSSSTAFMPSEPLSEMAPEAMRRSWFLMACPWSSGMIR